MSDFDDEGRRIPDEDEREEKSSSCSRVMHCPQCKGVSGRWWPASPQTYESPGEPAWCDVWDGSVEDKNGDLFCSAECLRIYTEE